MITSGKSTLRRAEEGAVLVEAAIALPIFFSLVLGVIQFSVAMWQADTMLQAVTHFGRYAMVHPDCDAACIQVKVQTLVPNATVPAPSMACTGNTNWMTVTASHDMDIVTVPGISLGNWSFSYRAPVSPC